MTSSSSPRVEKSNFPHGRTAGRYPRGSLDEDVTGTAVPNPSLSGLYCTVIAMEKADRLLRIASRVARASVVPGREGRFAAPPDQVAAHLQKFLDAKYAIDMAYRSFADRVKGPWRDALVDHWHEHAKEERKAAYDIAMRIVGLGWDPITTIVQIPACEPTVTAFCKCLMELELKAVENGRKLVAMAGDNTAMKVLGENLVLVDTQHIDDLRRMMAGSAG